MTVERAIEILTPDKTRYTPSEYEEALAMARDALEKKEDWGDKNAEQSH